MVKLKYPLVFLVLAAVLTPVLAFAHQPRVVKSLGHVTVEEPEISKVYYGNLDGEPKVFELSSVKEFNLYVNIMVPDLPDIEKNKIVTISSAGRTIASFGGEKAEWEPYYEKFAGDMYFKGPEFREKTSPGEYFITVSSAMNEGKYALVIGETESFPLREIIKAFFTLPAVKSQFFGEAWWHAYLSRAGLMVLGVVLGAVIIAYGAISFLFRRR